MPGALFLVQDLHGTRGKTDQENRQDPLLQPETQLGKPQEWREEQIPVSELGGAQTAGEVLSSILQMQRLEHWGKLEQPQALES